MSCRTNVDLDRDYPHYQAMTFRERLNWLKRRHRVPLYLGLLVLAIFVIWQVGTISRQKAITDLITTAEARVGLYANALLGELEKFRPLPYLLARDKRILALLEKPSASATLEVNQHLEDFNHASKAAALFLLDPNGLTLASSNWRAENTFVGSNFAYRPYFKDAIEGHSGGYFAVGVLSRAPGYYISYPVRRDGHLLGVIVVKIDLSPVQQSWSAAGENVAVSDAHGVFVLSSLKDWIYRTLRPLSPQTRDSLREVQYLDQDLDVLEMTRTSTDYGTYVKVGTREFIERSQQLPSLSWRIHYLSDLARVEQQVRRDILSATMTSFLLIAILLYFRERRLKLVSRKEAEEAQFIRQTNAALEHEISIRRETETHLRATQAELVQAGKLAALGRMSAAIAHEVNQPLTAIRTFVASAKIFLTRQNYDDVERNLDMVSDLTERMAAIMGQLKTFARKSTGQRSIVDLRTSVERVLSFLSPEIERRNGTLTIDLGTQPCPIKCDPIQLEQVITNLLNNALDATVLQDHPILEITAQQTGEQITLSVADNGPGIAPELLDKIFEPFFTTKDVGSGLGLGLSISYGIVIELGGTLRAENKPTTGAIFHLSLPISSEGTTQ